MTIPIYVPSRGRYDGKKFDTLKLLKENPESADSIILVVEPQEEELYREYRPEIKNYLVLPNSNQGIAYVRQYILKSAQETGWDWYWMLDDDIQYFGTFFLDDPGYKERGIPRYTRGSENYKELILDLYTEMRLFESDVLHSENKNIGQAGLDYRPMSYFAYNNCMSSGKDRKWAKDTYCDVAVMNNVKLLTEKGISYRKRLPLKEDRDFTAQILACGLNTVRKTDIFFSVPTNGSLKGGLQDEYAIEGREIESCKMIEEIWGSKIAALQIKYNRRGLSTTTRKSQLMEQGLSLTEAKKIADAEYDEANKGAEIRRVDVKFTWKNLRTLFWEKSPAFNELDAFDFYSKSEVAV